MSTLEQIRHANSMESAAKAYRYYQCSGNLVKALHKYDAEKTRVEARLK